MISIGNFPEVVYHKIDKKWANEILFLNRISKLEITFRGIK